VSVCMFIVYYGLSDIYGNIALPSDPMPHESTLTREARRAGNAGGARWAGASSQA